MLLRLESTQRNAMDGHSRVNSAHFATGGEISNLSITCFDIRMVVELLTHKYIKNMEDCVHWGTP